MQSQVKFKMFNRFSDILIIDTPEPTLLGAIQPRENEVLGKSVMTKAAYRVNCLFEDNDKKVWVGKKPGVDILDEVHEIFFYFVANGSYIYDINE